MKTAPLLISILRLAKIISLFKKQLFYAGLYAFFSCFAGLSPLIAQSLFTAEGGNRKSPFAITADGKRYGWGNKEDRTSNIGSASPVLGLNLNQPPSPGNCGKAKPAVEWQRTVGGDRIEDLHAIQQTSDGGYILGGYSLSDISGEKSENSKGGTDYWVVKLNGAGAKEWDKTIGGADSESLHAIQQTRDGGYILGGWSSSNASGDKSDNSKGGQDYWIVKLNAAGAIEWDKTIGGAFSDDLQSLQQTMDGGYILGGWSYSNASGDKSEDSKGGQDYWVVKLNAAGAKEWDKTVGGRDYDVLASLQQTADGGYILGGTSASGAGGDKSENPKGFTNNWVTDYWVVKLNAAGVKEWDKTIGGSGNETLQSLQQTADEGYILGGHSESAASEDKSQEPKGDLDYWVVKLNAAGAKEWDKTIGGNMREVLDALQQTADAGYILAGSSNSSAGGDKSEDSKGAFDGWVVKLNSSGCLEWDLTLAQKGEDGFSSLQQTTDGGYILGGDSSEGGMGGSDYWVVKLGPILKGDQVKSFTLINTESELPIRTLLDEDTLDLAALPKKLSIRADTSPDTVGSVLFELSGKQARKQVENEVPYALFGDIRGDYEKWYPAPGSYTLTATPYARPNGQGQAGTPLTIRFTVRPPQLVSFTLINTQSEQPIRSLHDGDTLDLAALPRKLNIRADTYPATVGSVLLALSGQQARTQLENVAPYALFGDVKGDYEKWYPAPGSYTLTATPYPERDARGEAGAPLTIRFTVVRKPAATPAARMEKAPALAPPVVYPNPTPDGLLQVRLTGQEPGPVRYRLLSAVGRKLAEGTMSLTDGGNQFRFDFSRQLRAPGLYYLRIEGTQGKQTFRIMRR